MGITVPTEGRPKVAPGAGVLVGKDGNAFGVIGVTRRVLRSAGASKEFVEAYQAEATSGDYEHLLAASIEFLEAEEVKETKVANGLTCFVCGGTYTADQRRRHEATAKHVNAAKEGNTEVRSPMDTRPPVDPAKVEAHVAQLQSEERVGKAQRAALSDDYSDPEASQADSVEPAKAAPAAKAGAVPSEAIASLEKEVKKRAADVRWTEKHDPDKTDLLNKRRTLLAAAESNLAAAKA